MALLEGICTDPDRWPSPMRGGMAGGGPRLGREDCWGRRPGVGAADGNTGALILGGSDIEEDVELDEVELTEDDPDVERGRAGKEGGCFGGAVAMVVGMAAGGC